MRASEMITELKELMDEHGDFELVRGHYEKTLDQYMDISIDGFIHDNGKFRLI